jgi:hypothetical protein
MRKIVPQNDYREAFIRLTKNVVPDGKQVGEIEIRRSDDFKEKAVTLYPGHKHNLRKMLREVRLETRPETAGESGAPTRYLGTLRAVDLDKNRLRLDMEGKSMNFKKCPDILDDMVGPLLNKHVEITGSCHRRGGTFTATDIDRQSAEL